jgi:peptide/nickel transport system substrate-binding protein
MTEHKKLRIEKVFHRRDFLKYTGLASLTVAGHTLLGGYPPASGAEGVFAEFGVAQNETIVTLDPYATTALGNAILSPFMYDLLLFRDKDNNDLIPWVATRYELVNDMTWRFHIRKGIQFWNGNDLTAHSVAFTMNRILDPGYASPQRNAYAAIDKAVVVDDYTVDFVCKRPFPAFVGMAAGIPILDEKYYSQHSKDFLSANPMGSGPFIFKKWNKGIGVEMEANPNWWGPKAPIQKLVFYGISEAETRTASLIAGQTKIIYQVPLDHFDRIKKAGLRAEGIPGPRMVFVGFNQEIKPFDDKRIRQACNWAVDNRKINEIFMSGLGQPMNQPLGPSIFGFNPDLPSYDQNLEKARQLMREAGYPNGIPGQITCEFVPSYALNLLEIVEAVGFDLKQIGINLKVQIRENAEFRARRTQSTGVSDFGPLFAGSWGAGSFDPQNVLPYLFDRKGAYGRNADPFAEEWIEKCMSIMDQEERKKELHKLEAYFHDQCPLIYLHMQPNTYAMSNDHDFKARVDERFPVYYIQKLS